MAAIFWLCVFIFFSTWYAVDRLKKVEARGKKRKGEVIAHTIYYIYFANLNFHDLSVATLTPPKYYTGFTVLRLRQIVQEKLLCIILLVKLKGRTRTQEIHINLPSPVPVQ